MDEIRPSEAIDYHRRHLFGAAAITIAAAQLGMIVSADAQSNQTPLPAIKPGTNASFPSIKQIDAGLLNVGYAEAGPPDGPAVILLHGWPYDIYSYVDVAPLLAAAGYRVIVPYVRGYGTTRFLSSETFRNGQPAAVALEGDAAYRKLSGKYANRTITGGVGHNPPQEAPQAFAEAVIDVAQS
jgi:pimeloyl-ACP methyl ester carboxylesterase